MQSTFKLGEQLARAGEVEKAVALVDSVEALTSGEVTARLRSRLVGSLHENVVPFSYFVSAPTTLIRFSK